MLLLRLACMGENIIYSQLVVAHIFDFVSDGFERKEGWSIFTEKNMDVVH